MSLCPGAAFFSHEATSSSSPIFDDSNKTPSPSSPFGVSGFLRANLETLEGDALTLFAPGPNVETAIGETSLRKFMLSLAGFVDQSPTTTIL